MLEHVIDTRRRDIGGFEVARALPSAARRMVGPFIFLDHMGPAVFAAGHGMDVRPHPHIGLSTVTYLFAGEVFHRDSLGVAQSIKPGEVNWMTAGAGITHSERTAGAMRQNGGPLHGIQSWVALPSEEEERSPSFAHFEAAELPSLDQRDVSARLIAGSAYGLLSPVATYSPLFYLHVELQPGASIALPAEHPERAAYIVEGSVEHEGRTYDAERLLVFARGDAVISAQRRACVMLLGGSPIGERYIWWNLVSSRRERIRQGKEDWVAGKFPLPKGDDREFIPAPDIPPLP